MRNILIFTITITLLFSCAYKKTDVNNPYTVISADSLINNVDTFQDMLVTIDGTIIHVCGVDSRKMKLKTEMGQIIKIVPKTADASFDRSYLKHTVKVYGVVYQEKIEKEFINKVDSQQLILCHIDQKPCKDTAWVKQQIVEGKAPQISKDEADRLRKKLESLGKGYIPVVCIIADSVSIIE